MPIYEFKCTRCGEVFEEIVMGGSVKEYPCPACGARKTRKVPSTFSFSSAGGKKAAGSSSCSSCSSSPSSCKSCSH